MLYWLRKILGLSERAKVGDRAENFAAAWLARERGFQVIARNWRNPRDRRDELDLICRDGETLVFVEVKARTAGAMVPGFYAVDARKKRVLRRTIEAYLVNLRDKPRTFRFDVVEVALTDSLNPTAASRARESTPAEAPSPERMEVLHFENVPLFSKHFRP